MKIFDRFIHFFQSRQGPQIRQRVTIPMPGGMGTYMTFHNLKDKSEHLAIGFGSWEKQETPLVRIHSECLTGDVFSSALCDCGEQLQEAITLLQAEGGLLLYLRQEGRGIGLYNKLDAYALQRMGLDTFEANQKLGFKDDLRTYGVAAQMLKALKISAIQLLSNNPEKSKSLESEGIRIQKLRPTGIFLKETNKDYLKAKMKKNNQQIPLTLKSL